MSLGLVYWSIEREKSWSEMEICYRDSFGFLYGAKLAVQNLCV